MSPPPRRAVVLAAGKGTRLWPLTETRPKPLVPIAGRPLLLRLLDQLARAGVREATVVVDAPDGQVATFLDEEDALLDLAVDTVVPRERRGTGHALQQAKLDPEAPVVVTNGDIFLPQGAMDRMLATEGPGMIAARQVDDPTGYGALDVDGGRLISIAEKSANPPSDLINAGVYVLPAGFHEHLSAIKPSPRGELELTDALNAAAAEGMDLGVHRLEAWVDVAWPWDLLEANALALSELEPVVLGEVSQRATLDGPVHVAAGATVKAGATIQGPAFIGGGCTVGPNAYIRAATTLTADNKVGHGCEVKNSLLFEGAKVPHLSYVGDSVLGREVNLGAGTQVANLRHDGANLLVDTPGGRIDTGRRKLGVILGDGVKTGINATLNCGVLLGPGELVGPGEVVTRSRVPEET